MEPLAVWTDDSYTELGATADFTLDLACGTLDNSENDFAIQLPQDVRIAANSVFHVDGTQWGGIVQRRVSDTAIAGVLQWEGRTWHGILADRVLSPDSGQDYYRSSGTVESCISALISRFGLSALFGVGECPSVSINYQHKRYPDGWSAVCDMLSSVSLKPTFAVSRQGGTVRVLLGAAEKQTLDEVADGELADVEITSNFTNYNHIIGLGKGELSARDVVHFYADANGNVSTTKTITGLAERVCVYDNSAAEHDDLVEYAIERLQDMQGQGSVDVTIGDSQQAQLGDYIVAYDQRIDATVTAAVTNCVVKIKDGVLTVSVSAS